MIVEHQIGIVLMGVAAQEAVVALEPTPPQRPAVIRPGSADLFGRGQMPLADAVGGIAMLQKHLGEEAVLERDRTVGAGGKPVDPP